MFDNIKVVLTEAFFLFMVSSNLVLGFFWWGVNLVWKVIVVRSTN